MIEDKTAQEAAIESLRTGKRAPIARLLREAARRLVHQAQDLEHFGGRAAHTTACSKLREAARVLYREADAQGMADARVTLDFVGDAPSSEPFGVYIVDKAAVTANPALAASARSIGMGRNVRKSLTRPGVYVVDVTIDGAV